MITPDQFPYITSIHVNDCYAYQDFDIPLFDYKPEKPFSHLILTGKNGSGKSTILRGIAQCAMFSRGTNSKVATNHWVQLDFTNWYPTIADGYPNNNQLLPFGKGSLNEQPSLYVHFESSRIDKPNRVETVIKDETLDSQLIESGADLSAKLFKQYLVNRKVAQAFSQLKKKFEKVKNIDVFFDSIEKALNKVFEDQLLGIVFEENSYEFYLELRDSRRLTFDVLSEGFSAFISILMDLFIRVDIIRKQVNDFSYNPCGIVLIDEPETHLHLQLQEQVLPLLTTLFPNIQFIAATHSPAVVASIKKATIFDLTTKDAQNDEVVGQSYSELMTSHFGLENNYSNEADAIIKQINEAVEQFNDNPEQLRNALQRLSVENAYYLSPSLRIELELLLAQSEARFAAHQ